MIASHFFRLCRALTGFRHAGAQSNLTGAACVHSIAASTFEIEPSATVQDSFQSSSSLIPSISEVRGNQQQEE